MNLLELRRNTMTTIDPKILYVNRNLFCDGSSVFFDTGFAPFSSTNINKDFKITMKMAAFSTDTVAQGVVLGCKYEGSLGGQSYPGFYIRRTGSVTSNMLEVGGYNYATYDYRDMLGKYFYFWREGTNYYSQLEGEQKKTLSVRVATFNQNIVIGAGVQTNGNKFRYSTMLIDYIRVELCEEN